MLARFQEKVHPWVIEKLGRDRLEYLTSNTMNVVTERLDPFLWSYECKAKIIGIKKETADAVTIKLLPNQHFQQPIPGQHIEIVVNVCGEKVKRHYTLSEINTDTVSITVKKQPDGKMSHWLHEHAKVGMVLAISSPKGQFVYNNQEKVLFISAGSGITPSFAILNDLAKKAPLMDNALYYRSRSPEHTIFQEALENPALSNHHFSYSDIGETQVSGNQSSSDEQWQASQLSKTFPDIKERAIYLCGPSAFKEAVTTHLASIDYNFDHLHVENFTPVAASYDPDAGYDGDVTVRLKSQNRQFSITKENRDQTLLEAAEAAGIQMEHGCRSGMCGTCRTHLIDGKISGNQLGSSIYPCTAYADSPEIILE